MKKTAVKTPDILKPEIIVDIILRRRWFLILPFCMAILIGIYYAFTLPKVYSASTLILIQPQKVPTDYVRSVVSTGIESRISTISQQIMSRTNLERIIEQFKIFSGPESDKMFLEDKIEVMRKRISVRVTRARSGADAFEIAYKGRDPETVMRVANTLATYFIDENLKVREAQAIGTNDFLENELESMRKRLSELEQTLKDYRTKYMGQLPEQLQTNLSILTRLQEQLLGKQEGLRELKNTLIAFEKQSAQEQGFAETIPSFTMDEAIDLVPQTSPELEQLRSQLDALKMRYTDKHPDVVRVQRMIADLEAEMKKKEEAAAAETENNLEEPALPAEAPYKAFDFAAIQNQQRDAIMREISEHERDVAKLQAQIAEYQQRVEDTPRREQELMSIKRDYANIKGSYDSLLNRKLEAEISVNMEKKQKGEQFRILDPAKRPERPDEPNLKVLFMMTVVIGLGAGAGIVFMLEFFDSSFRRIEEIDDFVSLPVLAVVPKMDHPSEIRKKRFYQLASVVSLLFSLGLFFGFALLVQKGTDPVIDLVRRYVSL